ncbi:MAG: hypothetical protein M3Z66_17015, partial [Chloroflexota bacterium]|nr:hypothetical protein [Chloroflexota bacterium]
FATQPRHGIRPGDQASSTPTTTDAKWGHFKRPRWGQCKRPLREGHDPGLADQLFEGMVERVVALVSRVEGTYEFEVQPLREYFVARHLYETAPYVPPGATSDATLPDRFDALIRNGYWLNVARFMAGCYNKGELASLVAALRSLCDDRVHGATRRPRELARMFLADWVAG